jgi:hypothetical protein
MTDMIDRLIEKLESIARKLEAGREVMTILHEQNSELRTLVLALQDRITVLEQFRMMHLTRIEMLEARAEYDRGVGRSP